jgi:hypothetical protein
MGRHKIISYPNVATFDYETRYRQFELQAHVIRGMRAVKKEDIEHGSRQAFIDFNGDKPEAIVKVRNIIKGNSTLEKRVKNVDKDHLNVMHIFLDTVGRQNFIRKYTETLKFLRKYHYLEKKNKRVYEFFRMHSIRGYTFPNLFASQYGAPYESWKAKHITSLYTYHKNAGYITAVSSDTCINSIAQVKSKHPPTPKLMFLGKHSAYKFCDLGTPDHMFYEFACDYNVMPHKNPFSFGMDRGPFSIHRNCLCGRDLAGKLLNQNKDRLIFPRHEF